MIYVAVAYKTYGAANLSIPAQQQTNAAWPGSPPKPVPKWTSRPTDGSSDCQWDTQHPAAQFQGSKTGSGAAPESSRVLGNAHKHTTGECQATVNCLSEHSENDAHSVPPTKSGPPAVLYVQRVHPQAPECRWVSSESLTPNHGMCRLKGCKWIHCVSILYHRRTGR